jgi:HSP20 family molecular chaperone IbpA
MNTLTRAERCTPTATSEPAYVAPGVDIHETKDEYVLEADMPGVGKEGLEVVLEANELTLIGRRQAPPEGEILHREVNRSDYRRTFLLDPVIDTAKIRAQIEEGLLTVHLPKAEKVKPRRIAVSD